jgi:hypothetical protein
MIIDDISLSIDNYHQNMDDFLIRSTNMKDFVLTIFIPFWIRNIPRKSAYSQLPPSQSFCHTTHASTRLISCVWAEKHHLIATTSASYLRRRPMMCTAGLHGPPIIC